MDIRKKTVKTDAKDKAIRELQEQVLQLHRDKTALMGRCKTLSRGLACSFCNFRAECLYAEKNGGDEIA